MGSSACAPVPLGVPEATGRGKVGRIEKRPCRGRDMGRRTEYGITGLLYYLLIMVLAYFDYGRTVTAALAGLLLAIVLTLTVLLSLIPFVGIFLQVLAEMSVIGWWGVFVHLPTDTTTVAVAFWLPIVGGAIICSVMSLLVIAKLR